MRIEEETGRLKLSFRAPEDHPFRMNNASVKVTLRTPALKRLTHGSNNDVTVNGLRGDSFSLANAGNGTVILRGKVTTLDITSTANGSIRAEELVTDQANVVNQANAGVRVNAKSMSLVKAGNGSVTNVGER